MTMTHNDGAEVTVWYDGECPLCVREIDFMRRLDRQRAIQFVEIQTADSCPIDTSILMSRFHAQERGQPIVSGALAFTVMWRAIPLLRPLATLARIKPMLWLLESLYPVFLKIRPWLQRRMRGSLARSRSGMSEGT